MRSSIKQLYGADRVDSLPLELLVRLVVSNVLVVVALDAGKDWLLAANAGVFWVLVRMLACGGLGVMVWEGMTGTLGKKRPKSIEVRVSTCSCNSVN